MSRPRNDFTQVGTQYPKGIRPVPLDELADYIDKPGAMEALALARKAGGQYNHGKEDMAALKALRDVHSHAGHIHRKEQEAAESIKAKAYKEDRSKALRLY